MASGAEFVGAVDAWLHGASGGSMPADAALAAMPPREPLIVVPLPPALYAGAMTLGAVAGGTYLRRRRLRA